MAIMKLEKFLPRFASVIEATSLVSCCASRKRGTGAHSFVSLLIINAVPTPRFGWRPQASEPYRGSGPATEVREAGEGVDKRNREPVAGRFAFAHLRAYVLGQMPKGVTLADAAFR